MNGPFHYSLFGLHIRSELRLPELLAADPQLEAQVHVALGEVPAAVSRAAVQQPIAGALLLTFPGIGRYAIAKSRITVDPEPGVPDANVRLFLLGSAMGALLHLRGVLPLHANAVEIGGKAFALMGKSGAGKSTLAAWFHDQGYRIIADDVCAVRFDEDLRPLVAPGVPRLRLWKQALEATGRQPSSYNRSYTGDEATDKFDVPISQDDPVRAEVELAGIYLLGKGDNFRIRRLQGLEAAEAIFANTYRGAYVPLAGNAQLHWESCVRLVSRTPIFQALRHWNLSLLAEQCGSLIEHAERGLPRK